MDGISDIDLGAGLGDFVIDENASLIAGILCYGTAFYKSGVFEKFIYTHVLPFCLSLVFYKFQPAMAHQMIGMSRAGR